MSLYKNNAKIIHAYKVFLALHELIPNVNTINNVIQREGKYFRVCILLVQNGINLVYDWRCVLAPPFLTLHDINIHAHSKAVAFSFMFSYRVDHVEKYLLWYEWWLQNTPPSEHSYSELPLLTNF